MGRIVFPIFVYQPFIPGGRGIGQVGLAVHVLTFHNQVGIGVVAVWPVQKQLALYVVAIFPITHLHGPGFQIFVQFHIEGIVLVDDLHIPAGIVVILIGSRPQDGDSSPQIGMEGYCAASGAVHRVAVPHKVQPLGIGSIRHSFGCRLKVADGSSMVQGIPGGIGQFRRAQAAGYIHNLVAPVVQAGSGQGHLPCIGGTSLGNSDSRASHRRGVPCCICISSRSQLQVLAEGQFDGRIGGIGCGGQVVIIFCRNLDGLPQTLLHIFTAGSAVRHIRREAKAPGGFRPIAEAVADQFQLVFCRRPATDYRTTPGGVVQPGKIVPGSRAAGLVPQDHVVS